jgi:hypothetical protein
MSVDILVAMRDKDEIRSFHQLNISTADEIHKCWLKAHVLIFLSHSYKDIYRHKPGRCCSFLSFVTYFFYLTLIDIP